MKQILVKALLVLGVVSVLFSCSKEKGKSRFNAEYERVSEAVRQQKPEARALVDSALMATKDSMIYYYYYYLLGSLYMLNAPDSILPCADRIFQFVKRQEPSPRVNGIAAAAYNLRASYYFMYRQNTELVLKDYIEAYRLFMKSDQINNAPDICANIGDEYRQVNQLPDAAAWYRRALVLADSINLPKRRRSTYYMGLGVIYQMLEDYNLSEEYFAKSKESYDSMHVNMKLTFLNNYGNLQYYKKDYVKALAVFQEMDSVLGAYNLRGGFEDYLCKLNLSDVLQNLGRTNESLAHLAPADSFFRAKQVNDAMYYANTIRLANALQKNDLKTAENIIATEPKNLTSDENMLDIRNRYLHDYYLKVNNIPLANYYERQRQIRRDSIDEKQEHMRAKDIVSRLTIDTLTLHNQLRMEEKNAVIERNWLVSAIVVSVVLFIALVMLIWILYLRKRNADKQQEIMNLKMTNMKNVITPHFTFNVLKHAMTFEDVHDAENSIRGVIRLMHAQVDIAKQMLVTLDKEMEFTQEYVSLAKSTIGENFTFHVEVPSKKDMDTRMVPSTFIQILVENAIKHGLKGLDREKELNVKISVNDSQTIIEVTDNGRGFDIRDQSDQYKNASTGTGLRVIQNTIDYYNKKNHGGMAFDIVNIKDKEGKVCGCQTTLVIPAIIKS